MWNPKLRLLILVVFIISPCFAGAAEIPFAYKKFEVGDIKPDGWIKAQIERDLQQGFAGHLDELGGPIRKKIFSTERVTTRYYRSYGPGEIRGNWIDGLVRMAYLTGYTEYINKANGLIQHVLDYQDEDGYIGMYLPANRYEIGKFTNGELWAQACIFKALLSYYELTNDPVVLEAVEKAAQLTMSQYNEDRPFFSNIPAGDNLGGASHGLAFVTVMEWLYRITGNTAYRDYGVFCYTDYNASKHIREKDIQIDKLLDHDLSYYGHAAHITHQLRVPIWVYYVTGDPIYKKAYENAYDKIQRHQTISGAIIGDEWIRHRKPFECFSHENCGDLYLMNSYVSALEKTGDASYGDKIEKIAFNAMQSARLSNGKAISYQTSDNRYSSTIDGGLKKRLKYSPTQGDVARCCPPTHTRFITYYISNMWMRQNSSKDAITAMLYGPCTLKTEIAGIKVEINEITDYPFSETITFNFNVERPVEFDIFLRVPQWAEKIDVKLINGGDEDLFQGQQDNYCRINKKWKTGDRITVNFETVIKPVKSVSGDVALQRGPLLYALPIPSRSYVNKTYHIEGFADLSFVPEEGAEWEFNFVRKSPNVSPSQIESCGFVLFRNNEADPKYPWDKSPLELVGMMEKGGSGYQAVRLVPLGSTILRRLTFPMKIEKGQSEFYKK